MEALFTIIICQNCGATNQDVKFCRKCGALLPVSSKSQRLSLSSKKAKKEQGQKLKDLDLQEIPKETEQIDDVSIEDKNLEDIKDEGVQLNNVPESEQLLKEEEEVLKEITPQPYKSSIMTQNSVSSSKLNGETKNEKAELESSLLKQKQLEKDMTEVLGFLSKKITVKKLDVPKSKAKKEKVSEKIPPTSMNEILSRLLTLDLHIEASAIIRSDGTILASALSNRISDTLFATIGQTLNQIGADIINGLSAGYLKSISVRGAEGVLDLAPIDPINKESENIKDMILVIYSHPKAKSGVINFAINIVKKQLTEYLGIKN